MSHNPEQEPLRIVNIGTPSQNGSYDKPLKATASWMFQVPITLNKRTAHIKINWGDNLLTGSINYDTNISETHWLRHMYEKAGEYRVQLNISSDSENISQSLIAHVN